MVNPSQSLLRQSLSARDSAISKIYCSCAFTCRGYMIMLKVRFLPFSLSQWFFPHPLPAVWKSVETTVTFFPSSDVLSLAHWLVESVSSRCIHFIVSFFMRFQFIMVETRFGCALIDNRLSCLRC